MSKSKSGFTIVELLIVIIVIAVLAAITIIAYNGVNNRAHNTAVASDFANLNKKLRLFQVDNGRYPTGATSNDLRNELETVPAKISTGSYSLVRLDGTTGSNVLYLDENGGRNFAIIARTKSMKLLYFTSIDATVREYTGTYATTFPAMSVTNLAPELGLNGSPIVSFYIYTTNFRIWN